MQSNIPYLHWSATRKDSFAAAHHVMQSGKTEYEICISLRFFWENKTGKDEIVEMFGTVVVYIIMACAVAGAIASAIKPESELGQ